MRETDFDKCWQIGRAFGLTGIVRSVELLGSGHVNASYRVRFRHEDGTVQAYVFQRLNTAVFHDPEAVMRNISLVTTHICQHFPKEQTLHFHQTAEGQHLLTLQDGVWRVMDHIDGRAYLTAEDPLTLHAIGTAYGRFQAQLADFDGSQLLETIPDFHNTPKRLETLFAHAEVASPEDLLYAAPLLEKIGQWQEAAGRVCRRYEREGLPLRVTHNDTKCSNVLLEPTTKQPLAVIDLDTVMRGMAVYDFGDAIRSAAVRKTAADCALDLQKFTAFAEGYLPEVQLCAEERQCLVPAVFAVTVELASRYLDDYLTNGNYFGANSPQMQLGKVRDLLELAGSVQEQRDAMEEIIERSASGCVS